MNPSQLRLFLFHRSNSLCRAILENFSKRCPLEVCFHDIKQFWALRIRWCKSSKHIRTKWARQASAPLHCASISTIWSCCGTRSRNIRWPPRPPLHYVAAKDFQRPRHRCALAKNTQILCGMGQNGGVNAQNSSLEVGTRRVRNSSDEPGHRRL